MAQKAADVPSGGPSLDLREIDLEAISKELSPLLDWDALLSKGTLDIPLTETAPGSDGSGSTTSTIRGSTDASSVTSSAPPTPTPLTLLWPSTTPGGLASRRPNAESTSTPIEGIERPAEVPATEVTYGGSYETTQPPAGPTAHITHQPNNTLQPSDSGFLAFPVIPNDLYRENLNQIVQHGVDSYDFIDQFQYEDAMKLFTEADRAIKKLFLLLPDRDRSRHERFFTVLFININDALRARYIKGPLKTSTTGMDTRKDMRRPNYHEFFHYSPWTFAITTTPNPVTLHFSVRCSVDGCSVLSESLVLCHLLKAF